MRAIPICLAAMLTACGSFPITSEPLLQFSPYLAKYRLRGDVAMQNDPGTGIENNAAQSTDTFGLGDYEDDLGLRFDLGDGFGGLRLDYYHLDMSTSTSGQLGDDFGALIAGDVARMRAGMDEWRLAFLQSVWNVDASYRGTPVEFKLAVGGAWANRDLSMRVTTTDGLRTQGVDPSGDAFYLASRFRAKVRQVSLDLDYAICPSLTTGDFDGTQHDIEARFSYAVPFQDVTMFAGYRYSVLRAEGDQDGFGWQSDLRVDGVQLGVTVTF
jgi:hypothetical protein